MLTAMTEDDWAIVLQVFQAVRSPRRQGTGRPEVSGSAALFYGSQHYLAGASGAVRPLELNLETVLAAEPAPSSPSLSASS
jgi:hypothetical protein